MIRPSIRPSSQILPLILCVCVLPAMAAESPSPNPSPTVHAPAGSPVTAAAATTPAAPTTGAVTAAAPQAATPAATAPVAPAAPALPAMYFLSSVAEDELYALFKKVPAFSALDEDLVGSPLTLMVTHTNRPTAGGQAAGLLSAVLSGSTLGIIPVVSSERLVIKYEVMLNGKSITSHSFERTATRAINIWGGADAYEGLGKAGMDWLKSTASEAAAKLAADSALIAVRNEIDYYFSGQTTQVAAPPAKPTQP
ncbi:MAG: hypothetical protein E6Q88_06675 [Lysobacteraceae bacterium]|nr:MAG: hypothetical protein E6Q88_06675 [Xanthomonadaceae bacterium]